MAERNSISGRDAVRAFERAGWTLAGRIEAYTVLTKPDTHVNLTVPQYKSLSMATLRALVRHAGLSPEAFLEHLLDNTAPKP